MRFSSSLLPSVLLLGADVICAASAWSFDEAVISVNAKGGAVFKDKLSDIVPLAKPVLFGSTDTLKIVLTAIEERKAKRPHQAFLLLQDQATGLEATFPFSVKESGKGKSQKDIPVQLLASLQPLRATILLASFGKLTPFSNYVFDLDVKLDSTTLAPTSEKPLRYGQLNEINHIFRADPTSGPKLISLFFVFAVLAALPVLVGVVGGPYAFYLHLKRWVDRAQWAYLGANLSHIGNATGSAPIAHLLFFGSIVAMEGLFFLYYRSWNLFQVLPVASIVGIITFLSGSKALSEVQSRRLTGGR